jgi:predicted dehydrogenase
VVVSSPIQFHHDHVLLALSHDAHVLCEKPLCATVEQARSLTEAVRRSRKHVAVGYQWSFGDATQALKADIRQGVLGAPRRLKTLVLWPRDERYYARNGWAGRLRDAAGRPVFDSPVNNACAHFLHNMLYVLGDVPSRSTLPLRVRAELYRAKPIENFDTAALRCTTTTGAELLFIVSHATKTSAGPVFEYEFEHATVKYDESAGGEASNSLAGHFVAHFRDGRVKDYGPPPAADEAGKLLATLDAIRQGLPPLCGVEAASAHVAVTQAAQLSSPITDIPPGLLVSEGASGARKLWVAGLDTLLQRCFREGLLPSETDATWASPGTDVTLSTDLALSRPEAKKVSAAKPFAATSG